MLALGSSAAVAQVCVSDMAGLVGALDAFNSGQSLVILLEQNTYVVDNSQPSGSAKLGAFGNEDDPASIVILGGYKANCTARELDPSKTTIDGNNEPGSFLALQASGSIVIEAVTIQNMSGDPTNAFAAVELGHNYNANASGESIKLQRTRVLYNAGNSSTASLVVDARGSRGGTSAYVQMSNNLIAHNAAGTKVIAGDLPDTTIFNNTFARNGSGLNLSQDFFTDPGVVFITNNIAWGNSNYDLRVYDLDAPPNVTYNLIGSPIVGPIQDPAPCDLPCVPSNHNLFATDPIFVNDVNIDVTKRDYHLHHLSTTPDAGDSPAINAGTVNVFNGISAADIEGNDRIVGSAPDMGAYESPVDDQHRYKVTTTADNGSNTSPVPNSLRWALKSAYDVAHGPGGGSYIIFDVPCSPIALAAGGDALPVIDFPLTIDGTTTPGYSPNTSFNGFDSTLCVQIYGGNGYARGLDVTGSGKLLARGLMLFGFNDVAIRLEGSGTHNLWGNALLANKDGVRITGGSGPANVGGSVESMRNLISGNTGSGIFIGSDAGKSTVSHNLIGLGTDGTSAYANGTGVTILKSPLNKLVSNTVSASTNAGITITGPEAVNNVIQFNLIGYPEGGQTHVSNGAEAILVTNGASHNTIGAGFIQLTGGNFITSDATGVWVDSNAGIGNLVLGNGITAGLLGIDLGPLNATQNGFYGGGVANDLKYFPTVKHAFRTVGTPSYEWVEITLDDVLHAATERVDLYATLATCIICSDRADPYQYLGYTSITTDANGHADVWVRFPAPSAIVPSIGQISATATSTATGDTSENGNASLEILNDMIFRDDYELSAFTAR